LIHALSIFLEASLCRENSPFYNVETKLDRPGGCVTNETKLANAKLYTP
jgi:hypothetical protein